MMERTSSMGLASQAAAAPVAASFMAALGLVACSVQPAGQGASPPALGAQLPGCPPAVAENLNQISVSGKTATFLLKDPRNVPPGGGGLRWKLNTNGYTFTGNGIGIASPPAGAASASTGTEFQWCFGPTAKQMQWKYAISFYADAAPSTVFTCDPTIISSDALSSSAGPTRFSCTAP